MMKVSFVGKPKTPWQGRESEGSGECFVHNSVHQRDIYKKKKKTRWLSKQRDSEHTERGKEKPQRNKEREKLRQKWASQKVNILHLNL